MARPKTRPACERLLLLLFFFSLCSSISVDAAPSDDDNNKNGERKNDANNDNDAAAAEKNKEQKEEHVEEVQEEEQEEEEEERRPALDMLALAHMKVQQREYKQRMYRDLFLFLVFYTLFLAAAFLQRDVTTAFHLEASLRDTFIDEEFLYQDAYVLKNFESIGEVDEFWQWTLGPFLNGIAQQNGAEQGYIKRYNRLLGSPRIRQHRVVDNGCLLAREIAPFYDTTGCYALYADKVRSAAPYGPPLVANASAAAFGSNACAAQATLPGFCYRETSSPQVFGRVADWYGSGGFYVDLSYNAAQARLQLESLRDARWIDLQTSAVMFTLSVYNPNVDMFVHMLMLVEFTPGGGFIMSHNFRSFPGDLYTSPTDHVRFAIEIVWVVMLSLWLVYTVYQMWLVKRNNGSLIVWLIRPWWNLVDVVNKLVFVVTTVLYILFYLKLERFKASIVDLNQETDFVLVEELGANFVLLFNIVAVNIIISTLTIFKFLNVNPRMSLMWKTLEKAVPDLVAFLVFFAIIFFTFVMTGYLVFGAKLSNFRTFTKSIFACFNMLLGDFNYDEMERKGERTFAPFFLTAFMILVTFILVNVFLAIVQDAYVAVQTKYQNRPTLAVVLRRWVSSQAAKVRACVGKTMPSESFQSAVVQISNARLKRYLVQLNVQGGHTDLTMEQIVRLLPDAPESHVDYLYNLISDPDALAAAQAAIDENPDANNAGSEEGSGDDAVDGGASLQPQPSGPAQLPDVLRSLLLLEDRLATMEADLLNAQLRNNANDVGGSSGGAGGSGAAASSGGGSAPSASRGPFLQRLKSTKNVLLGRVTQDYESARVDEAGDFGSLPPLPSASLGHASVQLQANVLGRRVLSQSLPPQQ